MEQQQRIPAITFFFLFVCFLFSTTSIGAPATSLKPAQHTFLLQKDGSTLEVRQWHDGQQAGWETMDKRAVLFNEQMGSWTYAVPDSHGQLAASNFVARNRLPRELSIPMRARTNQSPQASQYIESSQAQAGTYYQCLGAAGRISGTARNTDGSPLSNMEIEILRWSGFAYWISFDNWQPWTATTDSNGAYQVDVPPGLYQVTFIDPVGNYARQTLANEIVVKKGRAVSGVDSAQSPAGYITGGIRGSDTTNLGGFWVEAYINDGGNWKWYAYTHSDISTGDYVLSGLEAGEYKVRFFGGMNYIGQYYQGAQDFDSATSLTVTTGNTLANIDAMLDPAGSISGVVTGADGNLEYRFRFNIHQKNGASWEAFYGGVRSSSSDGSYRIGGLPAGTYRMQITSWDNRYAGEFYNNASTLDSATDINVTAGAETSGINAELALATISIQGQITEDGTGTPLGSCYVSAHNADYSTWRSGYSDSNGHYEIRGLPNDSYLLRFDCGDNFRTEYYDDTVDYDLATWLPISSAGGSAIANAGMMRYTSFVTGMVTDELTDLPLPSRSVFVNNPVSGQPLARVQTDVCGIYRSGVPAGSQQVYFTGGSRNDAEFYNNSGNPNDATLVSVPAGETVTSIDAALALDSTSITGWVAGPGGAPLGANITAAQLEMGVWVTKAQTSSNPQTGYYAFPDLPLGNYRIQFESSGYEPEVWDGASGAAEYSQGIDVVVWEDHLSQGGINATLAHTTVTSQCIHGDDLNLTGFDLGTHDVIATGALATAPNAVVPEGAVASLTAGSEITLNKPFWVKKPSTFSANIVQGVACP